MKMKKLGCFLLALCVAAGGVLPGAGSPVAKAADLTDGLIGHWSFDGDTEEARLANSVANATCTAEVLGTGVALNGDGGVSGGSAYFSKQQGSAIRLNGAELNTTTDDFTLAAWVKADDVTFNEHQYIFQRTNESKQGRSILFLGTSKQFGTYLKGANSWCNETITLGKWYHVAITCNHSTSVVQFYINGELKTESTLTGSFVDATTNLLIGNHKDLAANTALKGTVDEVRYYKKIVDSDTVKAIYDEHAEAVQVETLQAELAELIEQAASLSGGTEAGTAKVLQAVTEAQEYMAGGNVTAQGLTEQKEKIEAAIEEYNSDVVIEIAVDTDSKLRDIPSYMFGINHRYHKDGYGSWDTTNNEIASAFNDLVKDAGFGSVRYPGGTVSNLFTWKDSIGPLEDRTTTIAGNNFYSSAGENPVNPVFGLDEAMKWIYDDLDGEAIYVYGLGRGNPQDAADLVEYLNAPNDGSNPNGGTDWAQVRAENGHEEPYGVKCFEIGNEFSDTGQNYWMSGISQNSKGTVDLYIEGDTMTISGQQSYYQINNYVAKKGDWRAAASLSDGNQNEERYVYYLPVVEGSATVYVGGTQWQIVDSLEGQGAANVCTFDYETGKITFGDGTDGNIPQSGARITCNYKTEQAGFVDYYDAMKSVAEEIGMEIEVYSGIVDRLQKDFITKMHQKGYDDKYDGVIIHPYSSGYGSAASYEASLTKAKAQVAYIASHKTAMEEASGDNTKEVAVSEFGILGPSSDYQTSLGHALYIANHMIDCVNAGAAYQNKHCLVDFTVGDNLGAWQQCVIQCHNLSDGGYQYVATPSAHLFSIFNKMTGNVEVDQTITGNGDYYTDSNGTVQDVNVYSTKDDLGNTYVLIVNNKKSETSTVEVSVDERDLTGKDIEVWCLTSENVDDMNTLANPNNVTIDKTTVAAEAEALVYTLPAHSVTSFKIAPEKVSVTVTAGEGGTAEGSTEVLPGSEVTVKAEAKEGYEFDGWYVGDSKVSSDASYVFTATTEDITLTAKFVEKTPESETEETEDPNKTEVIEGGVTSESLTSSVSGDKASFQWAAVSGAEGYVVEMKNQTTGAWEEVKAVTGTSCELSGLTPGLSYMYRVRAYKTINGKRVYFANAAEKTVQIKLAAPKSVKTKKAKKGVKLTWKKVSGANGYIIYRSTKKNKGYKKIAVINKGSKKVYLDKKAKKGKTNYYKVKAFVKSGSKKVTSSFSKVAKKKIK